MQRDGLLLRASLHGDEQGPLVMLVHGFPDTPHSWEGVIPALTKAGYRVLVPWLRGYTAESVNRRARYGLLSAAEDLLAWRALVGARSAHLVGHDWGAALAMTLVGLNPNGWTSVSLLAVPPIPRLTQLLPALVAIPRQLRLSSYMLLMQSEVAESLLSFRRAALVRRIWQQWSPGWQFSEDAFAPTRHAFSNPDIAWAATRYYRSLLSLHRRDSRHAGAQLLRPISVPTLALAGLKDGCMNIRLHELLSRPEGFTAPIRAVRLPDCGHFLQAEKPQLVSQELLNHFRDAESSLR